MTGLTKMFYFEKKRYGALRKTAAMLQWQRTRTRRAICGSSKSPQRWKSSGVRILPMVFVLDTGAWVRKAADALQSGDLNLFRPFVERMLKYRTL